MFIRCVARNAEGRSPNAFQTLDGFSAPPARPVPQPGARVLIIGARQSMPESMLIHFAGAPDGARILQSVAKWYSNLAPVTVDISIDSIVFANAQPEAGRRLRPGGNQDWEYRAAFRDGGTASAYR
jgi:hypothetical protein